MTLNKTNIAKVAPVLLGFFVMGFCDIVGITVAHVKEDLLGSYSPNFRDTLSNLIPVALFSMFLIFSIPTGLLMNKIGRKRTVILSNVITIISMLILLLEYSFVMTLLAFALLGIANTILQVSINPLLTNLVKGDKLTSSLTTGQFVKAISAFSAPFIAALAASLFGSWQFVFFIYALIALFSTVWLLVTYVEESTVKIKVESFRSVYSILRDKTILLLFLGIVFVVGIDVGINTTAPKILIERCYLNSITAGYGPSMYFALRTLGTFLGAFILAKSSASKFFKINIVFGLLAMVWLLFAHNLYVILAIYGAIGFSISNIFAILFSMAMQARPDKRNEISGLMITGVFGGAVLPFLMGILSDLIGNQMGSVIILIGGNLYLTYAAFSLSKSASG